MGSVVKAITKPFKSLASGLTKAVGGILGQAPAAPQVINQAPAAIAAPDAPAPVNRPEMEEGGESTSRKSTGKKSLTIRRTSVGGGHGANL